MNVADRLREEGFKVTLQRLAIYDALLNFEKHPNAEMIYRRLHDSYPTMSLATVYKTMEIFEKIGLIQVLSIAGEPSRYDYDVSNHAHIRCTVCGALSDLHGLSMDTVRSEVEKLSNYEVVGEFVNFEGVCPDCLKGASH